MSIRIGPDCGVEIDGVSFAAQASNEEIVAHAEAMTVTAFNRSLSAVRDFLAGNDENDDFIALHVIHSKTMVLMAQGLPLDAIEYFNSQTLEFIEALEGG